MNAVTTTATTTATLKQKGRSGTEAAQHLRAAKKRFGAAFAACHRADGGPEAFAAALATAVNRARIDAADRSISIPDADDKSQSIPFAQVFDMVANGGKDTKGRVTKALAAVPDAG